MSHKYVLDASIWFEYLYGTPKGIKAKPIIEHDDVATSIIAVAELADKMARINHSFDVMLQFIQKRSTLIQLSVPMVLDAAKLKKEIRSKNEKFSLADGVNLATAQQEGATLVTADRDFSGVANVMIF